MGNHRMFFDIGDTDDTITLDTTIQDWLDAFHFEDWDDAVGPLNHWFDMRIPFEEWLDILTPEETRTLRDLCHTVSCHAVLPEIAPMNILGRECRPAGAFAAIHWQLSKSGIDISDLRPSTPLEPFLRKYHYRALFEIGKLAPDRLPAFKIESHPTVDDCVRWFGWSFLELPFSIFAGGWTLLVGGANLLL